MNARMTWPVHIVLIGAVPAYLGYLQAPLAILPAYGLLCAALLLGAEDWRLLPALVTPQRRDVRGYFAAQLLIAVAIATVPFTFGRVIA